jgi:3-phenylpropionate/trans-cinnamate dioxygenase ferredoxin reductase subunit
MTQFFADAHTAQGATLRLGEGIASFITDNGPMRRIRVTAAVGTSGVKYPPDIVVVGVGVEPNTELAAQAGLHVVNGIEVNGFLRTEDEHIWAIGDCTSFPNPLTGASTRLESVQNATDQAKCLARTLTGFPASYSEVPWFWSVQGKLKLQIAGIRGDHDDAVIRGDPGDRSFSTFSFRRGLLTAVESVNSAADHLSGRRLLSKNLPLTACQAAGPDFDLKAYSKELVTL